MKETLVYTLAIATALACGSCLAQSNVNVSGTLDLGVMRGYDAQTSVGGISRSNLAFSGSEDLGGGSAATFMLNTRFNLGNGAQEDPSIFWAAESTVGLKGAFGHIRLGRALTALWQNDWAFDPWYNYDSIASPAWWLWHGFSPADANVSATGASVARLNNGVFFDSPVMAGFSAHASLGTKKSPEDKRRSTSVALKYGQGPLHVMAAHEKTTQANTTSFMALSYAFGAVTAMGAYEKETPASGSTNRSFTAGLSYNTGAMTFNGGYGRQLDFDANFVSVGAIYSLSKRTRVYASLGHQSKGLWARESAQAAYGVGINHSF